jgi:hypothetical protein
VTCHLLFGVLSPSPGSEPAQTSLTFPASSPYAPVHPLPTSPAESALAPARPRPHWTFRARLNTADDPAILARNAPDARSRITRRSAAPVGDPLGSGGIESGVWLELRADDGGSSAQPDGREGRTRLTPAAIAFFADAFLPSPVLLPKSALKGLKPQYVSPPHLSTCTRSHRRLTMFLPTTRRWFPTMVMTLEFKHPVPRPSTVHAARTVGVYARTRFLAHPQNRHETYCEVWSAPADLGAAGAAESGDGWREKQVCLAVSTQMSLIVEKKAGQRFVLAGAEANKAGSKL